MQRATQPSAVSSGAASGDSSACDAPFDLFYRTASSTRSSIDSQEQQSERSAGSTGRACDEPLPSPSPSEAPIPAPATFCASAAASASAAAFSAFYGGSAFAGCQASRAAPLLPVQLTIQPLDMTPSASELASSLGAFAPDAFRNFHWQPSTTSLAMAASKLERPQPTVPAAATTGDRARRSFESSTSAPALPAGRPMFSQARQVELRSNSGGCSSDDVQSWPAAAPGRPQPQQQPASPSAGPVVEQDSAATRAAITTANRRSAILRFRQKREQRSFDKKVRYVSRKRLAEARPRVRGQFVKAEVAAAYFAEQAAKEGAETAAVAVAAITPMEVAVQW